MSITRFRRGFWSSSDQKSAAAPRAVLELVLATVVFGIMAVLAKRATFRLPGPEVALIRFLIGLCGVAAMACFRPLRANNWRLLALRGSSGGFAVLCYFFAIQHLNVGMATLLNNTAPVFTAFWLALFLRESVSWRSALALLVTTCGVALVLLGDGAFQSGSWFWYGIGVCSGVLSGAAVATMHHVRKTDGSREIFAAFCGFGALICGPFAIANYVQPSLVEWGFLVAMGFASFVAQLLMTHAFRFVKPSLGSMILQLTPVTTFVLGVLVLNEPLRLAGVIGACVTLFGIFWAVLL